jgi:hypothetical protein
LTLLTLYTRLGADPVDKTAQYVTELATILCELTKHLNVPSGVIFGTKETKEKDHGKALSAVREKCATAFWRTIYAKGNSLMSFNTSHYSVYGVRAYDMLDRKPQVKVISINS